MKKLNLQTKKETEFVKMDANMMAGLDGLPEEDKATMTAMIDQLQLRDRFVTQIGSLFFSLRIVSKFLTFGSLNCLDFELDIVCTFMYKEQSLFFQLKADLRQFCFVGSVSLLLDLLRSFESRLVFASSKDSTCFWVVLDLWIVNVLWVHMVH